MENQIRRTAFPYLYGNFAICLIIYKFNRTIQVAAKANPLRSSHEEVVDVILRAAIVFAGVLMLMPHEEGKAVKPAPASSALKTMQKAVLDDIAQVRADIAESQRERGGSLLDKI